MKKLILLATFTVAGFAGTVNAKTTKIVLKQTKCYMYVYDAGGAVIGMVEVKCPDVVVIN